MGTHQLKIIFSIFLILPIFFSTRPLWADQGDDAINWVEQNTKSLSTNLCQDNAQAIVSSVYGHYYQRLLEIDGKLRQIKIDSLKATENTTMPTTFEFSHFSDTLNILIQTERNTLALYDYEWALFVRLEDIVHQFNDFRNDWERISRKDNWDFKFNHPVMDPHGVIHNVEIFDGIEVEFDSNPISSAINIISKGLKSIFNISKNIKTNKKMKKARRLFYELQVTEAEFEHMVDENFLEKREELFIMIEERQSYAEKIKEDIKNKLSEIQNHFSYLDDVRKNLIITHHEAIFQAKLTQEHSQWNKQEIQLFLLDLELEIANHDLSLADNYQQKLEILKNRLLDYKKIFGEIK